MSISAQPSLNDLPLRRRILVVDDSSLNREMLADFVDLLGHDALLAENGQVGLDRIKKDAPDIILLDLDMPVMSGLELLSVLASDEAYKHIPIIVISGRDDMEHMTGAIALGATDFLSKPFNPTILEARLKSSIEKKDLRDRERELLSSLEKSYAALLAAEQSRDALTHMIVHDLGNPLSIITMNTEMLQMGAAMGLPVTPSSLADRLGYITTASATMGEMIQSMLDISKMESGDMPVRLEPVDLAALLGAIAERYRAAAKERSLDIEVLNSGSTKGDTIGMADSSLVERIVGNLLSNAFKYATNATKIQLLARNAPDGGVVLSVEDNGDGIPAHAQERIFDKFYQAESKSAGTRSGVGLGLAFCKMAAEAMQGDIRVESAKPNGTRFVVTLPSP